MDGVSGYKAGALNLVLREHTDPRAELIGPVDADYLVDPAYLHALVGYFADENIAFVQSPQDYRDYDGDPYLEACYDAYKYFFTTTMPSRNQRNSIIFAGTMGLLRRDLLEKLGGWNEWCITEDAETSLRLLMNGYSGIYVAKLTRPDTGGASHIVFVVRDDQSTSDLQFQTSDTTWQAYNQYGGYSLYLGSPRAAYKVSYNRPFATRGQSSNYGTTNWVFYAEYPAVRWLEANGYNVSYSTGVDSERNGALIRNHKAFLSVGHDEYWSGGQRANVEAARAAGVHLAFFSGNEVFWKTRWESSIDGSNTPYRTLVSYKETHANDVIDPADPPTWTGTWRDPRFSPPGDGGRPENALTGQLFTVNSGSAAITVPSTYANLRFWRNTSVARLGPGQTTTLATATLGYEWDEDADNGARPPGVMQLSSTTVSVPEYFVDFGNSIAPSTRTHNLTLYRHSSGALVFGAGTVQWVWGLDVNHDTGSDTGSSTPDLNIQQATLNLFADMGVQPQTRQPSLSPATASADVVPPTSVISSPANGASIPAETSVTITGTATDAGGGVVGGVAVGCVYPSARLSK